MSGLLHNKLVVGVVVAILVVVAWLSLSGSSNSQAPTLTTTAADGSPSSGTDQNLVSTLLALRAVKLDATIFSDPVFASLKDFSTPIVPEPVGRSDPFAPFGKNATAGAGAGSSDQLFTPRAN